MKFKRSVKASLLLAVVTLGLSSCATNKNKAVAVNTKVDSATSISGDTTMGLKDGNMIVQKKVMMNEELRRLQYEVYELEDQVYGNRKYGSLGLYGVLRDCKLQLSDPAHGGDGKLMWTEPLERVTEKEDEFKIGLDEEKKLVGISEEFLFDRINRFKGYKILLIKRQDEYDEKVEICKSQVKSRKAKSKD